jgi:hypothetical protein
MELTLSLAKLTEFTPTGCTVQCKVHSILAPCHIEPFLTPITAQLPSMTAMVHSLPPSTRKRDFAAKLYARTPNTTQAIPHVHPGTAVQCHLPGDPKVKPLNSSLHYLSRVPGATEEVWHRKLQWHTSSRFSRALDRLAPKLKQPATSQGALLTFMDNHISKNLSLSPEQAKLFLQLLQPCSMELKVWGQFSHLGMRVVSGG